MASVTEKPQSEPAGKPLTRNQQPLVDQQIRRTRRALKFVDFTAGLITLVIGVLIYLLTMAVLEHWVIPGGWSDTARGLLFSLLVLGIAWYSWRTFWPLLRQSINPAYAAQAIEESSPSLKNSLLNLLLLRSNKRQLPRQVYQAIEQQAAQRLSQVRLESVVDRSIILRLGYILVALTAICALYRLLSPKDLFSSAGRVLMPWSDIATPSRVEILKVTPGDTKVARGEQMKISAEVLGLEEDEPVRLLYSTNDKQIVRQEIPMTASAGGAQFSCQVPGRLGGSGGVKQDFTYWIEAGDARSPRYQVTVYARPTLVVNRLRYDYPAYTGIPSREVEHTGDIRAVEGTKVTLFAQANKPIKTAHIDFEADGRRDLLMNATDQQATITFPLELRTDRRTPKYQSYVLRYLTTDGNQNEQPPKYQIDVQPDYSPEIQLLLPEEAMIEVPLNQEVNFELEARDPDFALKQVMLVGKVGEEQALQEDLLTRNHTGRFVGKLRKSPAEMGLKVGDVLEYWGAAADNRTPDANIAYSVHRKLRVVGPWQGDPGDKKKQEGTDQQQSDDNQEQQGEGGQDGQPGAGGEGNSGESEQEGSQGEPGDGQQGGEQGENQEQQGSGGGESNESEQDSSNAQGDAQGNSSQQNQGESSPAGENGDASSDPTAGEGGEQGKVSSEGDDDGSAFERMAEHFKDQLSESGAGSEQTQEQNTSKGSESTGEKQTGENPTQSDRNAADGSPDSNQAGDPGESTESQQQQGEQNTGQQGNQQNQKSEGEGAQGEPAQTEEQQAGDKTGGQQDDQSPAGDMSQEQGEAGAGDDQGQEQGAPNPSNTSRPQDKQGDQAKEAEQTNPEATSTGQEQQETDSEGGQGGDRSGGGKEGTGQQADADGKGGAGQHQAADDGAGKAAETGEGETGERAGDQKQADGKTGESGDQKGNGSKQGEQAGEKPGGDPTNQGQQGQPGAEPSQGEPGKEQNQQPNKNQQQPPSDPASAGGQNQAGDPSGTAGNPSAPPPGGETQPGDDANLDYARKQTDLILDRLEDQLNKKDVDKDLLKKLGWTPDELRRFVDRWKNLKSDANKPGADDANQELNEALRSLGLRKNRRTGFDSKITKDKLRDLRETWRGRVPLEYQEKIRSYNKGIATAQENE